VPEVAYRKDGDRLFTKACTDRTTGNGFKLKEGGHKEEVFYHESGEALAQVAQRSCGCPLPGSVQGHLV